LPLLSMIMPCYNEEEVIPYTIPRLIEAFRKQGYPLELVACDNGSSDRTGAVIRELIEQGYPIKLKRVEVNRGYGNGVLESIPECTGEWIGIIPADGQVDAEDVVRVYESVSRSDGLVLGKVFRRFRLDGLWRVFVSTFYNGFMLALWPQIGSYDVNGSPKMLHRDVLTAMKLESRNWLLDPEIMIKAGMMGIEVIEMNAFSRMREHGRSHVQASTIWMFISVLLRFRFGNKLKNWKAEYRQSGGVRIGARAPAPLGTNTPGSDPGPIQP
jgi:glycosyltransferase involved in cell wall biosynthesis